MNDLGAVNILERAVASNPGCCTGLIANRRAFAIPVGPSEGPEALALIHADDPAANRFWYGYVVRHPRRDTYVALLLWSERLFNAPTIPLLFRRVHYWTQINPSYEPSFIRESGSDEAFAERANFRGAVMALASMIAAFDHDVATGWDGGLDHNDERELRVLEALGILGVTRLDGDPPAPPSSKPLRLATSLS